MHEEEARSLARMRHWFPVPRREGVYDDILRGSRSTKTLLSELCLKRSCLSLAAYWVWILQLSLSPKEAQDLFQTVTCVSFLLLISWLVCSRGDFFFLKTLPVFCFFLLSLFEAKTLWAFFFFFSKVIRCSHPGNWLENFPLGSLIRNYKRTLVALKPPSHIPLVLCGPMWGHLLSFRFLDTVGFFCKINYILLHWGHTSRLWTTEACLGITDLTRLGFRARILILGSFKAKNHEGKQVADENLLGLPVTQSLPSVVLPHLFLLIWGKRIFLCLSTSTPFTL